MLSKKKNARSDTDIVNLNAMCNYGNSTYKYKRSLVVPRQNSFCKRITGGRMASLYSFLKSAKTCIYLFIYFFILILKSQYYNQRRSFVVLRSNAILVA